MIRGKIKFMDAPQVFALDFDGVICDGMAEYWQSAWRTYTRVWQVVEQEPSSSIADRFCELRPTIEIGWEMPVLIRALTLGIETPQIQATWQRIRDRVLADSRIGAIEISKQLDAVRDEWIKKDLEGWLRLHRFYPGVIDTLNHLPNRNIKPIIITTKEGRFVKQLLQKQGVNIPDEFIWGKEIKRSKADSLRQILAGGQSQPRIFFVEDRLPTLTKIVSQSDLDSVQLYLADWGYNTPRERASVATDHRIKILSLADFSKLG
jgi:phosphoglycolate phosphatase-like HAD superfamily hydrolase